MVFELCAQLRISLISVPLSLKWRLCVYVLCPQRTNKTTWMLTMLTSQYF